MKAKWVTVGLCAVMQTAWAAAPVEEAHGFVTVSEAARPVQEQETGFRVEPAEQPVAHTADLGDDPRLVSVTRQVDQLTQQLQRTQRQLAQLKGQVEAQAHQLKQLQSHAAAPAKSGFSYHVSTPKTQPAAKLMSETDSYQEAFNLLMRKQYAEAKKLFYAYLKRFPQGQYGSNVNYWLGEIALIERDYRSAESAFLQVIRDYPHSGKYSDSQYKLAITHLKMGQIGQARKEFEVIEREHAGKTVARLAKLQLQQMA